MVAISGRFWQQPTVQWQTEQQCQHRKNTRFSSEVSEVHDGTFALCEELTKLFLLFKKTRKVVLIEMM